MPQKEKMMTEDRKALVLVLGAGRGQTGLIKAAKKKGCRVEAATIEGNYPGIPMADGIHIVDIRDKEAVAELAGRIKADAVISAGTDMALPALGLACERNGLPGPSAEAAVISSEKSLMKDAFEKGGVRTARHIVARTADEAESAADRLQMPLIVKAVDLQGSIGINVVFDRSGLREAFASTMKETKTDHCVIEEYLDGYEVSATAMVADGEVLFVLPTGDVRYGENGKSPIGHYIPLDCDEDILSQIREQVVLGIRAIGLDNCAVNSDLMVMDGKVYVLELTGRLGGNSIPEITSEYYQTDIYECIIDIALGDFEAARAFDFSDRENRVCFGQMLISERDGVLGSTDVKAEGCDIRFFSEEGDRVRKYVGPNDCVGQIVTVRRTKTECEEAIREAMAGIEIN